VTGDNREVTGSKPALLLIVLNFAKPERFEWSLSRAANVKVVSECVKNQQCITELFKYIWRHIKKAKGANP